MDKYTEGTIIVTGAGGFIGAAMVDYLVFRGYKNILAIDDFTQPLKAALLTDEKGINRLHRDQLIEYLDEHYEMVAAIIHLGARTDTSEWDTSLFDRLNLQYSKDIWHCCVQHDIPLLYASSAATYGGGEHGFDDNHDIIPQLKPLNPYGQSKQDFDVFVLSQVEQPPFWAGFKFFNVYGHKEYNKGRMASVIFHTFNQIQKSGRMQLFRSHRPDFEDGQQSRDFVYIKDVVQVLSYFLEQGNANISGIYNLGTGKARSFLDLARNTFIAQSLSPNISYIDTPADIRDKYQYFTEANIEKLRAAGYDNTFYTLEAGIEDYVQQYLMKKIK